MSKAKAIIAALAIAFASLAFAGISPASAATNDYCASTTYRYQASGGNVVGTTWFSNGCTVNYSSGEGVTAYAVGAIPGLTYYLVSMCGSQNPNTLNVNPVVPGQNGIIGRTTATKTLSPGYYIICFESSDRTTYTNPVVLAVF